ncbi:Lcc2 [Phlyctema vagabunda]|uniref:Lcc2 n=1 Tax=Phlyctema vagabunda TaxID=108571 RepID=A0ABR4PXS4_9HELO
MVPWTVGRPSNQQQKNTFQVGLSPPGPRPPWQGNISRWEMGDSPLWVNFSNPTILNINTGKDWEGDPTLDDLVVVDESEVLTADSWIYLLITATSFPFGTPDRQFLSVAHPIHLHGHDFAILRQSTTPYWDQIVDMKFDNPPRRDVALLPQGGYLILAFKADNPGAWAVHCHIAWHASSGLAIQIMEREADILQTITPDRRNETDRVCKNWNTWFSDPNNYFDPTRPDAFQDDSGI